MKLRYTHFIFILAIFAVAACADNGGTVLIQPDEDLPSSQQETFIADITSGSWNVGQNGTVTRDNVDVTDQFSEFVLTFNEDFTYSSVGGGDLWPDGTGTWQFVSETATTPILVGGVEMTSTVSAAQLNLIFGIDDPEQAITGRIADLAGDYHVTVLK